MGGGSRSVVFHLLRRFGIRSSFVDLPQAAKRAAEMGVGGGGAKGKEERLGGDVPKISCLICKVGGACVPLRSTGHTTLTPP